MITSIAILQRALNQANRALQLFLLSKLMTVESSKKSKILDIVKAQQQSILTYATPFIPSVLGEQKINYQQAKNLTTACQRSPWEQVIPLFYQGLQVAQRVEEELAATNIPPQHIITNQKQTIRDWQQALTLMLHPPQQQPGPSGGETTPSKATPQNLTESFRLIQEMYLEDQSQPEPQIQELHSW
jgi:hypothetical protein